MNNITTEQLAAAQSVDLIDVREPDEFASGHVPGARNIPLSVLTGRLDEFRGLANPHVICQAGGRSAQAVDYLAQVGIIATNVLGGTGMWIAENRPVSHA